MSDDVETVRQALRGEGWELCPKCGNMDGGCPFCGHGYIKTIAAAALDSLLAERDEARREAQLLSDSFGRAESMRQERDMLVLAWDAQAKKLEAEVALLQRDRAAFLNDYLTTVDQHVSEEVRREARQRIIDRAASVGETE